MNAPDWRELACRSRALVHEASLLMGALTQPAHPASDQESLALGAHTALCLDSLLEVLDRAPELAAHRRTLGRFALALHAWRRSVADASPLQHRHQTALLQQAAQTMTSCLRVESLSTSESGRQSVTRGELGVRRDPPPP